MVQEKIVEKYSLEIVKLLQEAEKNKIDVWQLVVEAIVIFSKSTKYTKSNKVNIELTLEQLETLGLVVDMFDGTDLNEAFGDPLGVGKGGEGYRRVCGVHDVVRSCVEKNQQKIESQPYWVEPWSKDY